MIEQTASSTPKNQSSGRVKKIAKRRRSEPSPPPTDRILGGETLEKHCDQAFIRKLTPSFVPEIISRCGNRWNAAVNKANAASIMRYLVTSLDIHHLGDSYIGLQGNSKKAEESVVTRLLRSGAHAARQHRNRVADTVRHLLLEQTTDDMEMEYVKEAVFGVSGVAPRFCRFMIQNFKPLTVFGVSGGKPLLPLVLGGDKGLERMEGTHPVWKELFDVYEGTASRDVFNAAARPPTTCVLNVVIPGHCNNTLSGRR